MIEVIKDGLQIIKGLTSEQQNVIKKELTLDNPAYAQVKQFSAYSSTSIPPFLTFYESDKGNLIVPRGYKIPFEHRVIEDTRVENNILYPKFKLSLRDTQIEAYNAWKKDKENGMLVLQTGKGKSILGCYLAYKTKQRTLIIVQKNDLVTSWTNDIELCFGIKKEKVGLIKAKEFRIGSQFTITTIQTLSKLDANALESLKYKFGMIITDESHHSPAKSYEVLNDLKAKYFVALTATDMRTDGLGKVMYWIFGDVAYRSMIDANDKDIMPYTVIVKETPLKYSPPEKYLIGRKVIDEETARKLIREGKNVKRKPLSIHDLREFIQNNDVFNTQVAKDIIKEFKLNKSCVAFFHTKEHVRMMEDKLISLGVPEHQIQLYYGDNKEEESVLISRANSKEVLITLATYSKLSEGTNIKALERGFLVSSLNNEITVIQSVGRLRRTTEGKEDVIIYDYHHKDVRGVSKHIDTRLKVYKEHKATITGDIKPKDTGKIYRGFKARKYV